MWGKNFFKLLVCLIISTILSYLFQYQDNKVICYDVIINIEIALFSVSLAIVALMITILDKYKETVDDQQNWAKTSTNILKEICENTIALLILIILLALASMLEPMIILIPRFNIMTVILLFCFIVSLLVVFDTTISVYKLVINLKNLLVPNNNKKLNLSQKEIHLIEAYRFLDDEHRKNLDELIRAITTNQQIDLQKQHNKK